MRLATATDGTRHLIGPIVDGELVDLAAADAATFPDLTAVLALTMTLAGRSTIDSYAENAPRTSLNSLTLLPPVPQPKRILCVGTNYADHVAESDRVSEKPPHPMIFTRFPSSVVGHEQAMVRPRASANYDYEGELAVVIGQPTRHATRDNALDAIAGYSCFMDGTLRDWQRHTSQFVPGKTFEQSGAFGPWIVTADEIADPYGLQLTTKVDGEVMQSASTSQLIFDLQDIIVYCSTFTTLEPGDVIASGTPGGVGYAQDPPRWLVPGNVVEVEISDVAILRNPVIDEAASA